MCTTPLINENAIDFKCLRKVDSCQKADAKHTTPALGSTATLGKH